MSGLTVIVPSRGRPDAAVELAKTFDAMCALDTRLIFAVDVDDPDRSGYAPLNRNGRVDVAINTSRSMVDALNRTALEVLGEHPMAIAFMGDDHRPSSPGWDADYLTALRDMGGGIVYGDDRIQGEKLPTQCAMSAEIVATLGYMAPPDLTHMYVDDSWLALGRAIGRIRYLPDVVIEHLHPVAGTAEWDAGYRRVNHPSMYARDQAAYGRWVRESLPVEAARVRAALEAGT